MVFFTGYLSANSQCFPFVNFFICSDFHCRDGFFFAVKQVSLLDQGNQARQSVYQLEQVRWDYSLLSIDLVLEECILFLFSAFTFNYKVTPCFHFVSLFQNFVQESGNNFLLLSVSCTNFDNRKENVNIKHFVEPNGLNHFPLVEIL